MACMLVPLGFESNPMYFGVLRIAEAPSVHKKKIFFHNKPDGSNAWIRFLRALYRPGPVLSDVTST